MLKLVLVVAVLAVVIYVGIRLLQQRGDDPGKSVRRPLAPDDDPDFLRGLDSKRHQRDETDS